jgi:hypothetical protein
LAMEEPSPIILPLLFFFAGTRSPSSNQSSSLQEKVLIFHPEGVNSPCHFEVSSLISTYVLALLHILISKRSPD